ncbi:MAG: zinc-finger domain-containing protein [Candidatus Accumulibacter sp.]|nr:zinc-finger domain-containing protein [Accumulibacter sp.]
MADPQTIEVTARELPLRCPSVDTAAWKLHPRVYLDVLHTGKAVCPYCGARYVLKGETPKGH